MERLAAIQERHFLILRHTVGWQRIRKAGYMDCIFFTPIMLADVVIYVMQVMPILP